MSEETAAARFITAAFRTWRKEGIPFAVLRNYETLPQATTNDIDILVEAEQRERAERLLIEAGAGCGYGLHLRAEYATLALYFSAVDSSSQVHFDLFTGFTWRGVSYLDAGPFLQEKVQRGDFFVLQRAHEQACNLLSSLVYSGRLKAKYQSAIKENFSAEPELAMATLTPTYGTALARQIVEKAAHGQWADIERLAAKLRTTTLLRQLLSRPVRTLSAILGDALRLSRRYLSPPGRVLVLCGPDGCGKSTVGPGIISRLGGTFSPDKGAHFHWKPAVLSSGRQARRGPATDPHSQTPRNSMVSLCFFAIHWLEFFLGWHLKVRPRTFRGGLVLIDRWYYDFLVDQRRYRLRVPLGLVRLGLSLLSKPDWVVLLDAPVEVLRGRKQEVPDSETRRQRENYLEIIQKLPNGLVIDAGPSPENVIEETCREVLGRMRTECGGKSTAQALGLSAGLGR
jgi:thymidylate kinase